MKKLWFVLLMVMALSVHGQDLSTVSSDFNKTQKTGMMLLGSWAIANLVSSPILSNRTTGHTKYFHRMNGYWNLVNLGLAGISYLGLREIDHSVAQFSPLLEETIRMEKILLFNAGLDVGYIMTGFFLRERSKNVTKNRDRYLGFGNSLILQGGFLLLFDLGFYFFVHQHELDLLKFSENLKLSLSSSGMSIRWRL